VAQVSEWLEFRVVWKADVNGKQRVTLAAEAVRGHDAVCLLLLPRGCGSRITGRAIEIVPPG
jgi:hypothetical protein